MALVDSSWQFTRAVTRKPGRSVVNGLRAVDVGAPDFDLLMTHHAAYIHALRQAGAEVIELEAEEEFPDALFVEDTALCLPEGVILMRPGAPSRLGEVDVIAEHLAPLFPRMARISGPGTIEAGDILTTPREVLVGQSARTNSDGIAELASLLESWGRTLREAPVPEGVLHFKTGVLHLLGNRGLAFRNRGLAFRNRGLAFRNRGFAVKAGFCILGLRNWGLGLTPHR